MSVNNIEVQKQKLFAKVLTREGTETTIKRMQQINDILNFNTWWLSILETLTGLWFTPQFGFGLTEFDIFHIDFDFELPSLDDLLKGIYIKINTLSLEEIFRDFLKIDFNIDFPEGQLLDFGNTLYYFFKDPFLTGIAQPFICDCIYGESYYGKCCYYNPQRYIYLYRPSQFDQLSGTLQTIGQMSVNPQVLAQWTDLIGNRTIAEVVVQKVDMLEKLMNNAFFLGFSILGHSIFAPREYKYNTYCARVSFSDEVTMCLPSIDAITFGFILDQSLLDVDRLIDPTTTGYKSTASRFAYYRMLRQKRRFQSPISGLVFMHRYQAMQSPHKNPSILKYATHRFNIRMIRERIKRKLIRRGMNVFDVNKYVMATIDLVYRKRIGHKRIKQWKAKLSEDEFKQLWLDKWVTQGLNKDLLLELYGEYITWVERVKDLD